MMDLKVGFGKFSRTVDLERKWFQPNLSVTSLLTLVEVRFLPHSITLHQRLAVCSIHHYIFFFSWEFGQKWRKWTSFNYWSVRQVLFAPKLTDFGTTIRTIDLYTNKSKRGSRCAEQCNGPTQRRIDQKKIHENEAVAVLLRHLYKGLFILRSQLSSHLNQNHRFSIRNFDI